MNRTNEQALQNYQENVMGTLIGYVEGRKPGAFCLDCHEEIENQMKHCTHRTIPVWAVFKFWEGIGESSIPVYEIKGGHKHAGCEADANRLVRLGIQVPETPKAGE